LILVRLVQGGEDFSTQDSDYSAVWVMRASRRAGLQEICRRIAWLSAAWSGGGVVVGPGGRRPCDAGPEQFRGGGALAEYRGEGVEHDVEAKAAGVPPR
jgi:hypothetical protein